jgi:phage tail-like protein
VAEYENPLTGFHFSLDLQNEIAGFFTECSGIGSEHEIIEHKVVNEKGHEIVMKIPGRLKWENITMKKGITSSMDVWNWRKQIEDGNVDSSRRDGSIIMYDQKLGEVARWNIEGAWPVSCKGPSLKSDSNELGIEELVLAYEHIERVS